MFKKLRNRVLLLNMITISIMMLIAFTSIYLITYKNVHSEINNELHKISEFNRKPNANPDLKRPSLDFSKPSPVDIPNSKPERSVSFSVTTDKEGNILSKSSIFEIDSEFLESAKKDALSQNRESGTLKLDGNHWAFIVFPSFEGNNITFLDITSQNDILTNLIYTFLIVLLVMLIFIFFISRSFANSSIKPVKEAFDKQKQFIADASHELKTPLAVINTNVDVLLSNTEDTIKNQSKWLHYIKSESERMSKLTNDLLFLSQIDHSETKMIFTKFNMSEAVEDIILTMEAVIFEHNISLNYHIEPNLFTRGNSEQIKQVVMILLDNALKYTITKGSVEILLKKRHNDIVLTVTNTGDGIPEEHLDKIFDRFYRTDKSRARKLGGYGLGLAIAKTIINQHEGKIYVKSIINQNTTFYLELPVISE